MQLKGKTAIITGAAGGLGQAFCLALAKAGANIIAADIKDAADTVQKVVDLGGKAVAVQTDVTNANSTQEMAKTAIDTFGQIDILVNNAGILPPMKPLEAIEEQEWDLILGVNLKGMFLCSKSVVGQMKEQGFGRIINISSTTFWEGVPMALHYVSSKGGVIGFTRSLSRELKNTGITVNSIAPGLTITPTTASQMDDTILDKVREHVNGMRSIQRDLIPEDLTGTLLFLASELSAFMTGQTLIVDGGMNLH